MGVPPEAAFRSAQQIAYRALLDAIGYATGNYVDTSADATINGAPVTTLVNSTAFDYKHLTFNVTATSASTSLAFTFRNDPAFWDLDNVAVTAVPEPESWALIALGLAALAVRRRRASTRR